jgi:amino acid efflux transporter
VGVAGADCAGFPDSHCVCHPGAAFPSAGGVAHFVGLAFGPRLERVTGWLFLSVIPVGLPAALHIATGFGQALFGWHNEQLLLAELGTLAIVWWVGSRGASSSANLQTLVAVLIVALVVAIWWAGDITIKEIPFPAVTTSTIHSFSPRSPSCSGVLSVWKPLPIWPLNLSSLNAISPRADDWPAAGRHGLLGLYRAGLHFHAFGADLAAAASLPGIVVELFGVKALWIACVIGYLACFASLNIYIQSFARLVWSQALDKPEIASRACLNASFR